MPLRCTVCVLGLWLPEGSCARKARARRRASWQAPAELCRLRSTVRRQTTMCNLVLCHCGVRRTYGSRCDCVYGPQGPPICGPSSGVKPAHSSISCSRCCGRVRRAPVRSIVSRRGRGAIKNASWRCADRSLGLGGLSAAPLTSRFWSVSSTRKINAPPCCSAGL